MQRHRARISQIYRIYKIVGVALLGVFVVSATSVRVVRWHDGRTREKLGLTTDGLNVIFKSPLSPSKVKETALDTNGDHNHDQWSVQIREGERWRCDYFLDDLDFDGTPDIWTVDIGNIQAGLSLIDDDNDAKPDRFVVIIANFSDKNIWYRYEDLDLNGIVDAVSTWIRSETHGEEFLARSVLLDGAWFETSTLPSKTDYGRGARIVREDGSEDKVIFDGGKWQVVQ